MTAEKVALDRLHSALFHLRKGLAAFVEARMAGRYGPDWRRHASRAVGAPETALDAYALLKTMIDHWREAFEDAFSREEKHRVRSFVSLALDARNVAAHHTAPLQDDEALRYLDAIHQLLRAVNGPQSEIAEVRILYDAQRYSGSARPAPSRVAAPERADRPPPRQSDGSGTIEERLLDYVRAHPDLDDDELASRLGIKPRQTINQAARRLEAKGCTTCARA